MGPYANFLVFLVAYLASLNEPDVTELALHEYKTATNMTEQFAALAALSQNPGQVRDDALLDFYSKWQDEYLVRYIHIHALQIVNKSILRTNVARLF
jgi:aminopeptidase N